MTAKTTVSRRQLLSRSLLGSALAAASAVPEELVGMQLAPSDRRVQDAAIGRVLPTGRQFQLDAFNQRLVVTEVGATLRSYQVGGREFLSGFRETELPASANGQLLLPWPGRCEGGKYTFQGVDHQLAITNIGANTAQHGLVRLMNWHATQHDGRQLVLELVLHPQLGYPFTLSLRHEYELTNDGLVVTTSATNVGTNVAPYATGMHPYFTLGTMTIDDNIVRVPARQYLPRTSSGAATAPMRRVDNTDWDCRTARRIGGALFTVAVAYADLVRDPDGRARAVLSQPSSAPTITVWTDRTIDFLTVYAPSDRSALAIEPCTAPSNALNHGLGLLVLAPGDTFRSSFGVHIEA